MDTCAFLPVPYSEARKKKRYRDRKATAGCDVREERIIRLEDTNHFDTVEESNEIFMSVFASANRPTAVFTSNELMGLDVLKAARKSGRNIPGDLSVVA